MPTRRATLFGLAALLGHPGALLAAPVGYELIPDQTHVGFRFRLNGIWHRGSMPIAEAKISLDPQRLQRTRVAVSLNARAARTGLIFATRAMTSRDVLHVARFPTIRFASRRVVLGPEQRLSGGARIHGDLTLRGVTRPLILAAALHRPAGSDANELSRLDIALTGQLSRAAFGADGYANLVADQVQLDIRAGIQRL
jgi:polyisoprenoid-binding protein YceI